LELDLKIINLISPYIRGYILTHSLIKFSHFLLLMICFLSQHFHLVFIYIWHSCKNSVFLVLINHHWTRLFVSYSVKTQLNEKKKSFIKMSSVLKFILRVTSSWFHSFQKIDSEADLIIFLNCKKYQSIYLCPCLVGSGKQLFALTCSKLQL